MLRFILDVLLLRQLIESRSVRRAVLFIFAVLFVVVQGSTIARGTALVTIDKLYTARNSREPRTEHWLLSVTYYLNPKQVSDQARIFPQFETINPLGLTITEFHENRMSVDPIAPGAPAPVASLSPQPATGEPR